VKIEHAALWVRDLEAMKDFYAEYFEGRPGEKYGNRQTGFESYFLSFDGGARLELMRMPGIPQSQNDVDAQFTGLIHLAFCAGSREAVDALTERLRAAGFRVAGEPRATGDGYYESVVLDPEGNRLEITA